MNSHSREGTPYKSMVYREKAGDESGGQLPILGYGVTVAHVPLEHIVFVRVEVALPNYILRWALWLSERSLRAVLPGAA